MTSKQMVARLRSFVDEAGSQKDAAQRLLISPQYLCDILGYRREVSSQVALLLGFDRKVVYTRIQKGRRDD